MAEIAGLVLGVVGVVKPLVESSLFTCDLIRDQFAGQLGNDAKALRVRISVSSRQIETFENILLAEKRLKWLLGSLFQELEPGLQQDLYDILREIRATRSSLRSSSQARAVDGPSWARTIIWSAKDKKTLEGLANEIEHWTHLLRLTVQDTLSHSPLFQTLDRIAALGPPEDQAEDLQLALTLRRILVSKPSNTSYTAPDLSSRSIRILPALESITLALMETFTGEVNVVVETKQFLGSKDPAEDEKRRTRVSQLATLLQQTGDPNLRALQSLGYIYNPLESRAMVIYKIPGHLLPHPLTLRELFSLKLLEARPALEHRFRLASVLTECLFFFHSLGWVYKSFMSGSILLFPIKSSCPTPWQAAGKCSFEHILTNSELRLVGFDLARPESEASSLRTLDDSAGNVFRPPTRWGVPAESWTAVHDLYSLGAVLLEVGLWQRLDSLDHLANLANPWAVQKLLISHAEKRLPYTMGSKYASIVTGLLKQELDDSVCERYPSLCAAKSPDHASNRLWILRELNKPSSCI